MSSDCPENPRRQAQTSTYLGPALVAPGAWLALRTPAVARVAAVALGALALADDAVRVGREVLAAAGLEGSGGEEDVLLLGGWLLAGFGR